MKNKFLKLISFLFLLASSFQGEARATGDNPLNTSFGGTGYVVAKADRFDRAGDVALQPDGKIVFVGWTRAPGTPDTADRAGDIVLLRYLSDGTPDSTFGTNGMIVVSQTTDGIYALVLQPDQKMVLGGTRGGNFLVARFMPDGSADAGFGENGFVTTQMGNQLVGETDDVVYDLAIQSDGKIIAVGSNEFDVAMVRYLSDGQVDMEFGTPGPDTRFGQRVGTTTDIETGSFDAGHCLAIQSDGKVVVGGRGGVGKHPVLVRYTDKGLPDPTFGTNGISVLERESPGIGMPISNVVKSLVILSDGRIFGAGGNYPYLADSNGNPDASFIANAKKRPSLSLPQGVDLVVNNNGQIFMAGSIDVTEGTSSSMAFSIFRYLPDGNLDKGYDGDGIASFGLSKKLGYLADFPAAMAMQADGTLLVAGEMQKITLADSKDTGDDFALIAFRGETTAPVVTCDENRPCDGGFACVDGACLEDFPFPLDDCVGDVGCSPGFRCEEARCRPLAGGVCDEGKGRPCASGLSCVDGICIELNISREKSAKLAGGCSLTR